MDSEDVYWSNWWKEKKNHQRIQRANRARQAVQMQDEPDALEKTCSLARKALLSVRQRRKHRRL